MHTPSLFLNRLQLAILYIFKPIGIIILFNARMVWYVVWFYSDK